VLDVQPPERLVLLAEMKQPGEACWNSAWSNCPAAIRT
jgi:hypothetical protein